MFTLVIGGAASGKSEYAESLILASPYAPRYYIATMEPYGSEGLARVEKHRRMRMGKQFETVERYVKLADLRLPKRGAALLECVGNLAANELYSPGGAGTVKDAWRAIIMGVQALLLQCGDLVVVSNEVFTGGTDYARGTEDYMRVVAGVNHALAQYADQVCEVVCGLPQYYKEAVGCP